MKVVLIYGGCRSLPRYQDTRYAYDFPLCFPHELLMSLRNIIYIYIYYLYIYYIYTIYILYILYILYVMFNKREAVFYQSIKGRERSPRPFVL